ncbi:MAG: NUDIX hydrolase [Candidatus Micrarchaeia archaeon]
MDSNGDYSDEIVGIIGIFSGEVPYIKRGSQAKIYPGKWCIPSGHRKVDETEEETAIRELEEETGYRVPEGKTVENLGRFAYLAESGKNSIKLNITLFLYMTDEKPEIRLCDEHTDSRYVSIDILSDKENLFLYTHARGIYDFTPIDNLVIDKYMPEAYDRYKKAIKSKAKSIA